MNIIQVKNLKKQFRTFKKEAGLMQTIKSLINREYVTVDALAGVSFNVRKGEIRGFIGPNGAGKSTTIKILSGILYPNFGEVNVNNYEPWSNREKYVKTIGVVFGQKQQLSLDLPAVDTFQLNKTLYEIPESNFKKNLDHYVKLMDLTEIIKRPVRQLSLGEKMKCELISSLLHDPVVVFLDEPTIGLDLISKEKIRNFIKQINKEKGTTFLLTTHDLDDIENLCENILILNKGRIVFDGELSALKDQVIKTKILDIKFREKVKDYGNVPEGIKILHEDNYSIKLEVDRNKHEIEKVLSYIIKHYPLMDINVSSPEIETIIKRIYESPAL